MLQLFSTIYRYKNYLSAIILTDIILEISGVARGADWATALFKI